MINVFTGVGARHKGPTVSGVRGPVDVTVTSVNGRSVYFDIDVAKTGTPDVLQSFWNRRSAPSWRRRSDRSPTR